MDPSRFVTDSSLDFLARRLRFLGFDVVTLRGARLEELLEVARHDGRIALTASSRHPRRFADVGVIQVRRERPADALREIARAHRASSPPFGRCPACNAALERRLPMEAFGEVPGRVLRSATDLRRCPHCGKWYWNGTHVGRIREWLERALGRAIETPEDAPPAAG